MHDAPSPDYLKRKAVHVHEHDNVNVVVDVNVVAHVLVDGFRSMLMIQNERRIMYRGYTCLHRKIWSNALLAEPGKRFSRLEAWLYITNVLAAGKDDQAAGLTRERRLVCRQKFLSKCISRTINCCPR